MNAVTQLMGRCPCGACQTIGTKIAKKTGHLVGCDCVSCRGSLSVRKGHRGQQRGHEALGGNGRAPWNEDRAKPYVIEVALMPESKVGSGVPKAFADFLASTWLRHAFAQADRAVPVGSGVSPSLMIDGRWLVVDTRPREPRP